MYCSGRKDTSVINLQDYTRYTGASPGSPSLMLRFKPMTPNPIN